MPRPTLKDQRSAEILDAYLTCVARFGLEGATQERIAAEAGVKRPLLRHYLGNRDDMTAALADHVINAFAEVTEAVSVQFGSQGEPSELIDALFDDGHGHDPRLAKMVHIPRVACHPMSRGQFRNRKRISSPSRNPFDASSCACLFVFGVACERETSGDVIHAIVGLDVFLLLHLRPKSHGAKH